MAQAAVLTVNAWPTGSDNTQHQKVLYGLVTFTGSGGYTTGGVPLNWTTMVNADGSQFILDVAPSTTKPFVAYFTAQDTGLIWYQYNQAGNTLFAISGAGVQVASATTLSGVIVFEAHFGRGV